MTKRAHPPKRPDSSLTLGEAAERLGVHYMTAYRYVRLGQLPATYAEGRWWVRSEHLDAREAASRPPPRQSHPQSYRDRLYQRLHAGDEPGSWSVVESAIAAGMSPRRTLLEVIAPALQQVGDQWERTAVTVADEHRMTAVALRLVSRLGPRFARRGRSRGAVVLAGAPGDPHSLPVIIAANVLRGERFAVVELGADTPTDSLVEVVRATPRLLAVGISVSADRFAAAARRTVRAVRDAAPELTVFVGGPAVRSLPAARGLGAHAWAADAGTFADQLEELRS